MTEQPEESGVKEPVTESLLFSIKAENVYHISLEFNHDGVVKNSAQRLYVINGEVLS